MKNKRLFSLIGVSVMALIVMFGFGIAKADAAITIQGDAYNPSYNLYLFGYTAAQANPCNGVAEGGTLLFSLSNLYDPPNKITPDVSYDDNNDFSTSIDNANAGNTFIYLCNGVGGGLGNLLTNTTILTAADTAYSVDIASAYGTSLDATLNGKNVVICDELDGTKLNGTARQVAGQTYEQYYLKYSAAGHITADDVYVLITDSDACTFDSGVVSGRRVDITSSTSWNVYGVQIPYSPDTKVIGDTHVNLSAAKMELKDASNNSIGLTEVVAVADGDGADDDYTMYYQKPLAGDMSLTITSVANGTTIVSAISKDAFTAGYDFVKKVSDSGTPGVPDDIAAITTAETVGGDAITLTTTRYGTYVYSLYVDDGGALQEIDFQKPAGNTVFHKHIDLSDAGDEVIDVGKVAGRAHADISTGGNDLFEIFSDATCSTEVSSNDVFGAASAYEVYFEDTGAAFYIKTTQDNGGTTYESCGNQIALTNQAVTQNLDRKITAVLPTAVIGANTADTVMIDFNKGGTWTAATDVWSRDIESGTAILYTINSPDGDDYIVVADDGDADPTNGLGTTLLTRTKDFSTLDVTLNAGGVEGDTHADLNDNAADRVTIYSDNACTATLVSSATVAPAAASDPDYGIFYESTGGATNYYANFVDSTGATVCVKFAGDNGADTILSPLYKLTTTKPNANDATGDQINSIAIDNDKDGAWDAFANNADAAATNVAYSVSDGDSNVYAYYGTNASGTLVFLKTSGVVLTADETVSIASISGDLDDDFIAATASGAVTDDAAGLIAAYTDWDNNTIPTGLSNSHYVVNEAVTDTYAIYLDVSAGAIANVDMKLKDQNNLVSWTMNIDDSATTIAAGESVDVDLAIKVSGDTPVGTDHINLVNSVAPTVHLASGVIDGVTGLYAIYTIAHDPLAGNTIQGIAQEPKNALADTNAKLIRDLTAIAASLADVTYNVAEFDGTNHADLNAGTVVIYSGADCTTQVSSEVVNPGAGIWTQYFEGNNGTTYYTKIATAGGLATCRVIGDALAGNTQTVSGIDFLRKISGTVKDTSDAGTDVLSVAAMITGAANNYFSDTVDGGATTYQMYVDSSLAGAGDTVRFYSAASAGGTKLLDLTKDLSANTIVNVSAVNGNTHADIQGGANRINAVCSDHSASNVTCTTKYSSEPQTSAGTYEIFFEQQAGTTYYVEVLDSEATETYYSWDEFTNAGAGAYTTVELDGKLNGSVREAYNTAIKVGDVTIKMYTNTGDPETNQVALTYSYTGVAAPGGQYRMYGNLTTQYDVQYAKNAYITQSAVDAPHLDDTLDIDLVSGVKIIVREEVSNDLITDATVSIYACSGATVSTCTAVLDTCTQPSGNCTRTGDNSAGNGASGEYYFSGIPTGDYIQIKVNKGNYATIMDPDPIVAANATYQISDSVVQPAGLATASTYFLDNPAPSCTLTAVGGTGTYSGSEMIYADIGQDVTFRLDCSGETGLTVTADVTGLTATAASISGASGVYTFTSTVAGVATGLKTITVTATDGVNPTTQSIAVTVDATAPATALTVTDPGVTNTTGSVKWEWNAAADNAGGSGIAYYNVKVSTDADCSEAVATDVNITNGTLDYTYPGLTSGSTYYACVTAFDNVGNSGTQYNSDGIVIDTSAPSAMTLVIEGGKSYTNDKDAMTMTYSGADVTTYSLSCDNSTWVVLGASPQDIDLDTFGGGCTAVDGTKTFQLKGVDANNNVTATAFSSIILDQLGPTVGVLTATNVGGERTVTLTWTAATDATSGVSYYDVYSSNTSPINKANKIKSGLITLGTTDSPQDGTWYYTVYATDKAGNESVLFVEQSVTVDTTVAGIVSTPVFGTYNTAGLATAGGLTITPDATGLCKWETMDATYAAMPAGHEFAVVAATPYTLTSLTGDDYTLVEGLNEIYVRCQDASGNTNLNSTHISFYYDTVNPTYQIISVASDGNGKTVNGVLYANTGDTITLRFQASEVLAGDPTVTIGGGAMAKVNNDGGIYTYTRQLINTEDPGATIAIGGTTDVAANGDTDLSDATLTEFDFVALSVTVTAPGTQNSKSFLINATVTADSECRMDEQNLAFDDMNRFGLSEIAGGTFQGTYIVAADNPYTIYVRCRDYAGNDGTDNTGVFTVATTEPSVLTITPTISLGWQTAANVTVTLTTDVNATCKYDNDETATFALMDNTIGVGGGTTHTTTIANTDGINYYYVLCQSTNGVTMTSPITVAWKGDINNPNIPVRILPVNGTKAIAGSAMMWSSPTDGSGSGIASYTLLIDSDATFAAPDITVAGLTSSAYVLTAGNITTLTGGTNYWRVQAIDNAGLVSGYDTTAQTMIIDKTAPTIEEFGPSDHAVGVAVNRYIFVLFNKVMDTNTCSNDFVHLLNTSDADAEIVINEVECSSTFTLDGVEHTAMYVTPHDDLTPGDTYSLVIDAGSVKDISGNAFAGLAVDTYLFTTTNEDLNALHVDDISMNEAKRYATVDGGYNNGWEWNISLTVPTTAPRIRLKFSNFGTIPANANVQYFSTQELGTHVDQAHAIEMIGNDYPAATYLTFDTTSDTQTGSTGYQVVVTVQVKIPAGTVPGSYAGQFQVESSSAP